jgi:hypothetical protein
MAGPRVGPKARPRTGSGLPTTSFLRPALQDVDGAPSHTMTCERQCAASADSFVCPRTLSFPRRPAVGLGAGAAHQHGPLGVAEAVRFQKRLDGLLVVDDGERARPVGAP